MPKRKRSDSFCDSFDEFDEDSNGSNNAPVQRNAANARERARMRVLSSAFSKLKTKLPNIPADTKLSKLDTLRLATIYIQQLKSLLDGQSDEDHIYFHQQQNLTWPFTFQQITGGSNLSAYNINNNINIGNNINNNHINTNYNINMNSSKIPNDYYNSSHMSSVYETPEYYKM